MLSVSSFWAAAGCPYEFPWEGSKGASRHFVPQSAQKGNQSQTRTPHSEAQDPNPTSPHTQAQGEGGRATQEREHCSPAPGVSPEEEVLGQMCIYAPFAFITFPSRCRREWQEGAHRGLTTEQEGATVCLRPFLCLPASLPPLGTVALGNWVASIILVVSPRARGPGNDQDMAATFRSSNPSSKTKGAPHRSAMHARAPRIAQPESHSNSQPYPPFSRRAVANSMTSSSVAFVTSCNGFV